ncbi:hypothetical protein AcW1_010177 [Taiwanofungus camphoratus]|nr:hypothetical protein AcV5_003060 [Antrodia cinnamomea]KAI0946829.1 hypothetical protein AcW1_010177 [Antrodia cinnamomea]KAI0954336.1 hypothetical protein AcV7_007598 [Antrodia cinnamomea]
MLSFSALSVFATLALSAFTSAVPLSPTGVVNDISSVAHLPAVPIPSGLAGVIPRDAPRGVCAILQDVTTQVTPYTVQLQYLKQSNATIDVITPIVNNIKGVLGGALGDVNGLVGQSTSVILATVDGTAQVTVTELAQIIAGLMTLIFDAVSVVLDVVSSDLSDCVTSLLCTVGELLGCLVCAIAMLVGSSLHGLLSAVVGLVGSLFPIIIKLNVSVFISLLGITL